MAAHIFDIDGTVVEYHTNKWLAGAKERIIQLHSQGHQIIFMTMRGLQDSDKEWSIERTGETILHELDEMGIEYAVLFGIQSPRVLHDDNDIFLDKRNTDQPWI